MTLSPKHSSSLFAGIGALLSRAFTLTPARTLLDAINQHQIVPFYQPFFDSQTGKIAGIEVLARWQHPLYGHIPPDTFIPQAEKYNLIALLTHQLIQQVIVDLQHRIHFFPEGMYICLNLSAHNCLDPRFESDIIELIRKLEASQIQVIIEVTERHPLHFTPQLNEWFATLRKSRIAVALDDFGTGYSNISYIHALAPEFIKIDRLFVSQIGENSDSRLIDCLIELANKMQLRVIAEGVETQCQADYLREKKIDFMQGYHFSRAIHIEELVRMAMLQK